MSETAENPFPASVRPRIAGTLSGARPTAAVDGGTLRAQGSQAFGSATSLPSSNYASAR